MGIKVVGKLESWGDADLGSNDFMALEEGSNPVRMITSPYQFYIHWTTDATNANRKVHCAVENCPVCQEGERAVARWYVGVINRKTKKPAILEIGPQIFKQILMLAKKDKWGDPRKYDIDVLRQPKGSQPLYVVSPEPKESLDDSEKAIVKEFLARVDLTKMSAAPSADDVREKVGMSAKKEKKEESKVSNDFEDGEKPATETTDSDDSDFNFDQ